MMRALILAVAVMLAYDVCACECISISGLKRGLKRSSAYFVGYVVAGNENNHSIARIRVIEAFKGVEAGSIVEVDASGGCGTTLATGGLYSIQAFRIDGMLHTGMCYQTRSARAAGKDLYLLRRWSWWWRLPISGRGR